MKWFYKTTEWKRLRYVHLAQQPACVLCGRSAKDGARMNVDPHQAAFALLEPAPGTAQFAEIVRELQPRERR